MNTVARLLPVIGTVAISAVLAADPVVSESDEPPSQPAAATPAQSGAQPPPVAKPDATKSGRKVLVDDTVTDAQLKQILNKGFKPENQARGHEVYYCRSERELGSRFETKVCQTAARILEDEQGGKEATTHLQRTGGNKPQQ